MGLFGYVKAGGLVSNDLSDPSIAWICLARRWGTDMLIGWQPFVTDRTYKYLIA